MKAWTRAELSSRSSSPPRCVRSDANRRATTTVRRLFASVAGVWDVAMTAETGTGIACPDRSVVWTLYQSGCNVTIQSESWDTANGATGGVTDNRVYVEWIWLENCYRYHETLDVVVDGDTMTGTYYMFRGQAVYPAYCPGLGGCSASVSGVRRAP